MVYLLVFLVMFWMICGNVICHKWAIEIDDYTVYDMLMCFLSGCLFGPFVWLLTYGRSFVLKRKTHKK